MRWILAALLLFAACKSAPEGHGHGHGAPEESTPLTRADEPFLQNIKQLTNGGENAEAYFNKEGTELIFQSKRDGLECDQIYRMNADGENLRQVSVGEGRTTCSFIQLDGSILYASTHGHGKGCLWSPDHSMGYVWPIYPEMDIWKADADGKNAAILNMSEGYDAEATVCPKDGRIIFTSTRDGDLDLYMMDADGKNVKRMTNTPGYDGGAFFSADCTKIVWRASRPEGPALTEYQQLLSKNLVRPSALEIYVMDVDGQNVTQLTKNGAANFAPYLHPSNRFVLFASNVGDPKGRDFDIYMVGIDGTGVTKVTTNPTFDGFPMFTHDGKRIVFASNRHNAKPGETNVFIADWAGPN
jgi:TolB protein